MERFLFSFSLAQQPYTLPTHVPLFLFKDEQKKEPWKQFCIVFSNWINQKKIYAYKFDELCEYAQMVVRNYIKYVMRFKTIAIYTNNFSTSFLVIIKII
jgi:hypothetical protein